ncbi:MAG: YdcF family protein [Candidatus Sericytochromatia bacterium]
MAQEQPGHVNDPPQRNRLWWALGIGLSALGLSGLLGFLALACVIGLYSGQSDTQRADAALVLGAAVANNVPTPVFAARIDHAIGLYRRGQVPYLVLTGGVGAADTLAESEAARRYCLQRGVSAGALLSESQSRTTWENLRYAQPVLARHGLQRVLLVSDPLHMRRAVTQARDLGLDAHPSPTRSSLYRSWRTQLPFLLRESWFYGRYLLIGE